MTEIELRIQALRMAQDFIVDILNTNTMDNVGILALAERQLLIADRYYKFLKDTYHD